MFERYEFFVRERHRIWEARQAGEPGPWTEDPVLATRKFTNVFRVLDPGSQFVFQLAHPNPAEELLRLFLYRSTGSIPAWERVRVVLGDYPTWETLEETLLVWQDFRRQGGTIFTPAYIVFPGPAGDASRGTDKIETVIDRTAQVFADRGGAFLTATTQSDRFAALVSHTGVGDFIAMQTLTDWGYGAHCGEDRENEFIVAGPGARRGAKLLDPSSRPEDTIRKLYRFWQEDGSITLAGRTPSLMDVQNTTCELSKFARYKPGRRAYQATTLPTPPVLPAHWKGTPPL
jgi:hypothetical protein